MKKIIVAALIFLLPTVVAYAAGVYNRQLPARVVVTGVAPSAGLQVYTDAAGTIIATSIDYGTLVQGQTGLPAVLYVKNTGALPFLSVDISNTLAPAVTVNPSADLFALAVGETKQVSLTLAASATALGTYDFVINFDGTY